MSTPHKTKKPCKICKHDEVFEINRRLKADHSLDQIVKEIKGIAKTTLHSHAHDCLQIVKVKQTYVSGVGGSKDIGNRLENLYLDVEFLIAKAKAVKNCPVRDIAIVIGEGRKLLDSILKLEQVKEAKQDPEEKLKKLIAVYSVVLAKFPEAQKELAKELEKLEL